MVTLYRLVAQSGSATGAFPLDQPEMVLGRDPNTDIPVDDKEISRRHARLFQQGGNWILEDLGSLNGTYVNNIRLTQPHILRPGEVVNLGDHVTFLFEAVQMDPDATVAKPASPRRAAQQAAPAPDAFVPPAPAFTPPAQPQPVYTPPAPKPAAPPVNPIMPPPAPAQPQAYSGQVPQQPDQFGGQPAKKKLPTWAVVVIVAAVILLVICVIPFIIIDATNQWCNLFGGIFNGLMPGSCPL